MVIIPYNTHLVFGSITTETPSLALCLMTFAFSIPQWSMPRFFKCLQSKISHYSRYGSDSLYCNQARLGLCAHNRYIFNAKLCAQGFVNISTKYDGWRRVLPPYLCPNPIWTENPICGPFGCSGINLRQRNKPNSISLWHFLILCHCYQQHYYTCSKQRFLGAVQDHEEHRKIGGQAPEIFSF